MSEAGAESPHDDRPAAPATRLPKVPPAPSWPRPWHEVLEERGGEAGLLLWFFAAAVHLWTTAAPETRPVVFTPGSPDVLIRWIDRVEAEEPELARVLRGVARVCATPWGVTGDEVAAACEGVMRCTVLGGLRLTPIHYAEAVARLLPSASRHAYVAARLNREAADWARATQWFHVAARLARIAGSETDFAIAQLGWGNLHFQRGELDAAERHLLKAVRAARRNRNAALEAAAHHDLIGVCADRADDEGVIHHASRAAAAYPRRHPSIPKLAYDVGLFLVQRGYFSASMYLLARCLSLLSPYRITVLSALARAAAATRERIRFERCAEDVLAIVTDDDPRAPAALYNLAEGARSFELWDRAREMACEAIRLARHFENRGVLQAGETLLAAIDRRESGEQDRVPERGGPIELLVIRILKKLNGFPRLRAPGAILFPQDYPEI
jgi:tetratricopeptide (TPR) repeat protein